MLVRVTVDQADIGQGDVGQGDVGQGAVVRVTYFRAL